MSQLASGQMVPDSVPPSPVVRDTQAERARIELERAEAARTFTAAEAACYQRFAVNDCLRDLRRSYRLTREALRRQEVLLNDLDRQQRAEEKRRTGVKPDQSVPAVDPKEKRSAEPTSNVEPLSRQL